MVGSTVPSCISLLLQELICNSAVSGSKISYVAPLERSLTPLSGCLRAGLQRETIQTAAGAFIKLSNACDEHPQTSSEKILRRAMTRFTVFRQRLP